MYMRARAICLFIFYITRARIRVGLVQTSAHIRTRPNWFCKQLQYKDLQCADVGAQTSAQHPHNIRTRLAILHLSRVLSGFSGNNAV
jgi:hypothetical protein